MTFNTVGSIRKRVQRRLQKSQHDGWIPARTGRLESTGLLNANPAAGLPANKIWVRLHARDGFDGGRRQTVVWNTSFAVSTDRSDTPVWIGFDPDGELEIKGLRNHDAHNQLGAALQAAAQHIIPPELWRQLHRIPNVFELRPYSTGTLILRAKPGWVNGLKWGDSLTLDLAAHQTGTASMQSWVVAYLLKTAGALAWGAATGSDLSLAYTKNVSDIQTVIATLPAGAFPLIAVLLRESDTTYNVNDEARTEDLRDRWMNGAAFTDPPTTPTSITATVTIASGRGIVFPKKLSISGSGRLTVNGTLAVA